MKITTISICMDREDGQSHATFWRGVTEVHFYDVINFERMSQLVFDMNYNKDFKCKGFYDDEGRRMFLEYRRVKNDVLL